MRFLPDITVIGGCGHVGLPLSIMFAHKGMKVYALDIKEDVIKTVNSGVVPFLDKNLDNYLKKVLDSNNFLATDDDSFINQSEVVIIIIGTPVDEHLNPRFNDLLDVIKRYLKEFKDGQLLVLRSTVYPGTSKMINEMLIRNGLKIDIAFCPERIAQGYSVKELTSLPQIISSFTKSGLERSNKLFSLLTNDIIEVEPMEAELAKLFTNAWRYINFAIANQFYMVANDFNLDFYRIHHAMTYKYPRLKGFAKAGFAAGPCLFKDTMQIASFYKNSFFLGHSAMLVNEGLPDYIVDRLKQKHDLINTKVGILGMTFKADNDDIRESLSFKLKKILEFEAKEVYCSDYHLGFNYLVSEKELIDKSDIILIATPHSRYNSLDFKDKRVYDIWNILGKGGKI